MTATEAPPRALIQFRSTLLERRIAEYASLWDLTPNETAKRMTALAAAGLNAGQYGMLASFSQALGGPSSFVKACHEVRIALDAANRAREEMGLEPLEDDERTKFIESTIEEMKSRQGQRRTKNRKSE